MTALAALSMEELAGHLWQRRTADGGVRFARVAERPEKESARNEVLRAFSPAFFPKGLSLFTMPGLEWKFENELLHRREHRRIHKGKRPERTFICGIEREEAVFRASFKYMPGTAGLVEGHGVAVLPSIACATATVRTDLVQRYHRCTFEDYAEQEQTAHMFDGAWLDFNGQLTERRIAAIERFWGSIRSLLVVTVLDARTGGDTTRKIKEAGGVAPFLASVLPGSRVVRRISYRDTSPMAQVTLARVTERGA